MTTAKQERGRIIAHLRELALACPIEDSAFAYADAATNIELGMHWPASAEDCGCAWIRAHGDPWDSNARCEQCK